MFRRNMAFGGSWYPENGTRCEREIQSFWETPLPPGLGTSPYGVVPHAGWVYSGSLAARVFQALPDDPAIDLAVVLGGHLKEDDPVVAMVEGSWETPFGPLPVDEGFRERLGSLPAVIFEEEGRFFPDNSTELQLPFVRYKYPHCRLLPIRVPPASVAIELGRLLADYLREAGRRAVVLASTDLTHYGPAYGFEPVGRGEEALRWVREENDKAYLDAMTAGESEGILRVARERRNACSSGAVVALNEIARPRRAGFRALEYGTSQDRRPHDAVNFVGYVGGVFSIEPSGSPSAISPAVP